jgi:hypothetical protein
MENATTFRLIPERRQIAGVIGGNTEGFARLCACLARGADQFARRHFPPEAVQVDQLRSGDASRGHYIFNHP